MAYTHYAKVHVLMGNVLTNCGELKVMASGIQVKLLVMALVQFNLRPSLIGT